MSRVRVKHAIRWGDLDGQAFWRAWLADKERNLHFGRHFGTELRAEIERRVTSVEAENRDLKLRLDQLEVLGAALTSAGYCPADVGDILRAQRDVKRAATREAADLVPSTLLWALRSVARDAQAAVEALEAFSDKEQAP